MDGRDRRLLLITTSYPSAHDPVSGLFVARLALALRDSAPIVVVAPGNPATGTPEPWPAAERASYAPASIQEKAHGPGGVPAAIRANPLLLWLMPALLLRMAQVAWRRSAACSAIVSNWSVCGLIGGALGRWRGIPSLVVLRGEDANRAHDSWLFRTLLRASVALNHATVTVSEDIAQNLRRMLPARAQHIHFIPNGVSDHFRAADRSPDGATVRLLFVGSLIPRKSAITLIDALALLPARFRLTVVGEGRERPAVLARIEALGLGGRVELLPFQLPDTLPAQFARADALVLPSLEEGRANVILEAFAAGLPVFASDIPGNRELIGADERGTLFATGDAANLASKLIRISEEEIRQARPRRARAFLNEQGLDWQQCAARYLALITTLDEVTPSHG